MKTEKWLTTLWAAVLAFGACLGGMGCLATGMSLDAEPLILAAGFAILCVIMALCFHIRLPWLPLVLLALAAGYLWQEGSLRRALATLFYDISVLYDMGYGWGVFTAFAPGSGSTDTTAGLLILGVPIALFVIWTVDSGTMGWFGGLIALIPLMPCLLLKDTVPGEPWLMLLLASVLLILLTQGVRGRSQQQGNRLCTILFAPVALGVWLLFLLVPQQGYDWQSGAQKLEDFVLSIFQKEDLSEVELPVVVIGDQETEVKLSDIGPKTDLYGRVMTVTARETGTLYLRGSAYDTYDGTTWSCTAGWNSWDSYFYGEGDPMSLSIETERPHSVLYFTYSPYDLPANITSGQLKNKDKRTAYTVEYLKPLSYDESWDLLDESIGGEMLTDYLQLPHQTRTQAEYILQHRIGMPTQITNAGQVWQCAEYLAEYVSKLAPYDLNTQKMPSGRDDFALWFLENGETGYCVHYATTATVLLRAAGIPARYVTGYLVQAKAGEPVTVRTQDAHAWVECFINGKGWVVLEPTPAGGTTPLPVPEETEPTESTETAQTQPSPPDSSTATQPESSAPSTTTLPQQTQPISPIGGKDGPQQTAGDSVWGKVLLWSLGLVLAVCTIILQWRLRVLATGRALTQGDPNRQALHCWQAVCRRSRALKEPPPKALHALAQKAKFSQHTLTEEDLSTFRQALAEQNSRLKKKPFFLQPIFTLILALY